MKRTVVLAWGNDFHRDDGAGRAAAQRLRQIRLPGVEVHDFNQLVPEHAELLVGADRVIFLDAYPASSGAEPMLLPLRDQRVFELPRSCFGHALQPTEVAALAEMLFGASAEMWLGAIPGVDFELGEGLSETARRGVETLLEEIEALIRHDHPAAARI
ncbi:MAG: hydrogenase maturation protease [Kiritimatiellae bacterium]|nr:hydrogenase maturation protease [Kiritimatiellia bacterium]MDW8458867.1 hydrogenase maturation protease [Verrucomicrobiota bacterium]